MSHNQMNISQGTAEWKDLREEHLGSSDISAVMGISPWKTAYQLWLEKTGRKNEDEPNFAMFRGVALESEARLRYSELTGNEVLPSIVISEEWPVAMASLDGISLNKDIICEIKCPGAKNFDLAMLGVVPPHYESQIQWQLWVTKAGKCDYFVYQDKDHYKLIEVWPDPNHQKLLVIAAKEFWAKVISDETPELTEKDYLCVEDPEAKVFACKWKKLKESIKEQEELLSNLEKTLLEYSDDGNCFFGDSGVRISRVNRKGNVDWKAVCKKWSISDEELEKFRKETLGYAKFSIR